jgi:hypothetical protein
MNRSDGHFHNIGSARRDLVGRLRTRTLDPLIKSDPEGISTEIHADVKLEDLYTWD